MQDELLSNMNQSSVCCDCYGKTTVYSCKLVRHALDMPRTLSLGMYASQKYRISAKLNYAERWLKSGCGNSHMM